VLYRSLSDSSARRSAGGRQVPSIESECAHVDFQRTTELVCVVAKKHADQGRKIPTPLFWKLSCSFVKVLHGIADVAYIIEPRVEQFEKLLEIGAAPPTLGEFDGSQEIADSDDEKVSVREHRVQNLLTPLSELLNRNPAIFAD
jgi:hypothetical protein